MSEEKKLLKEEFESLGVNLEDVLPKETSTTEQDETKKDIQVDVKQDTGTIGDIKSDSDEVKTTSSISEKIRRKLKEKLESIRRRRMIERRLLEKRRQRYGRRIFGEEGDIGSLKIDKEKELKREIDALEKDKEELEKEIGDVKKEVDMLKSELRSVRRRIIGESSSGSVGMLRRSREFGRMGLLRESRLGLKESIRDRLRLRRISRLKEESDDSKSLSSYRDKIRRNLLSECRTKLRNANSSSDRKILSELYRKLISLDNLNFVDLMKIKKTLKNY